MSSQRPKVSTRSPRKPSGEDAKPIGFLLQRAHNLLRAQLLSVLEGSDLHLGHIAILGALSRKTHLTQRELSEWTGIEKSSMVIFLDGLERRAWIRRAQHPTDRRAHAVGLTPAGAERLAILGPRLGNVEEQFTSVLSLQERKQLAALLSALIGSSRTIAT